MMPQMTGMELYRVVERSRPELAKRFVFLTGGPSQRGAPVH